MKTFFEFKRSICSQLTSPLHSNRATAASNGQQVAGVTIENALGIIDGSYMLIENLS
jgi:hypothetical protein